MVQIPDTHAKTNVLSPRGRPEGKMFASGIVCFLDLQIFYAMN